MKGIIAHFLHRLTVKLVSEDFQTYSNQRRRSFPWLDKVKVLTEAGTFVTPMLRKTKTRAHKVKGSLYDEEKGEEYTKREFFTVKM